MRSSLKVNATLVADEFIDQYMPAANGEYVKVYLYLLRHKERQVTVLELADALNRTESDIQRALTYWERLGVLLPESGTEEQLQAAEAISVSAEKDSQKTAETAGADMAAVSAAAAETAAESADPAQQQERGLTSEPMSAKSAETVGIPFQRKAYTPEQVRKLSEEEEFTQLLYVAQKYLNKVFTPRECEVFAYLYDGLRLPAELLEYLVEYCVQGGHGSIRYLETVGLNRHERGIRTVEQAKQYTVSYSNEAFAVMRAFGLSDRRPGSSEMEMIQRWFREWGFSKELILEACARTLAATNKPSFAYADRILMEWKKAEVHTMEDVRKLDEQREKAKAAESSVSGKDVPGRTGSATSVLGTPQNARGGAGRGTGRTVSQTAGTRNRFLNFEQRDTDYDAIVLKQLKERLGKQ